MNVFWVLTAEDSAAADQHRQGTHAKRASGKIKQDRVTKISQPPTNPVQFRLGRLAVQPQPVLRNKVTRIG